MHGRPLAAPAAAFLFAVALLSTLAATQVCPLATAVRPVISAGGWMLVPADSHTLVLRSDGTLWASGSNGYGQLGLGDTNQRTTFAQVGADTDWTFVSCGGAFTMALKQNGTLWGWGFNGFGGLGDGSTMNRLAPVQIGTATDWATVATGMSHTVALKADGSLWAWGHNSSGEVGDGSTTNRSAPVRIGSAGDWTGVACGYTHSAAWNRAGELWTWGDNFNGQLGDNNAPVDSHVPLLVDSATDWAGTDGGASQTIARKASGRLWAWGGNIIGQLGLGDTTDRHRPAALGTAVDWSAHAEGAEHTIALKNDGSLWCWGWNTMGQLGTGDLANRLSPTQIGTAGGALLVTAGFAHSACVADDGYLHTWGYNQFGQLGLGDTTDRHTPTLTTLKIDVTGPNARAKQNVTVRWGKKAKLQYSLADELCTQCTSVKIKVTKGTTTYKTFNLGARNCDTLYTKSFTCKLARGTYKWQVFATDSAGNVQSVQNTKKLIVK